PGSPHVTRDIVPRARVDRARSTRARAVADDRGRVRAPRPGTPPTPYADYARLTLARANLSLAQAALLGAMDESIRMATTDELSAAESYLTDIADEQTTRPSALAKARDQLKALQTRMKASAAQ